ncbi:hypothetical protein [Methylobrevis pamukkalensis]|uniref:Methyltransferase n=1 Tax=Methylobrevis pamukkalensis TaxID=1439726 RepID=A0A1E3GZ46_9HYPH|nr:hypothetical protein [Methylobrevis pamukkalensis]ODN69205.1 hypothetical protein A6302_03467 [Methylobrevis pamukkalensis]
MSAPSARGLFRATGKTPRPVAIRDLITGEIRKVEGGLEREKDDFNRTPPEPTRAFLATEGGRLRSFGKVWEPAAGDGAMVRELVAAGLDVVASDLIDRGCGAEIRSFYDYATPPAPAIVTNPPFQDCGWGNGKARWLRHALAMPDLRYMALLLNWSWPGAGGLGPFWAEHPPARVYLMRWKIDFTGQGAPPALHAWFVWDAAHRARHGGETVLRMLDRADARQGEMFGDEREAAE